MTWFKDKELSEEEYDSEMRRLSLDIARLKKRGELEKLRAELKKQINASKGENGFGKFLKAIGDMGANVKSNLDKEARNDKGFHPERVTKGLPGIGSKASKR